MKYMILLGRICFAYIFLFSSFFHFTGQGISYGDSAGVPLAAESVPFSGVMALVGAISIIIGYKAKWGAWILVAFLIPVTLIMHNFWAYTDPMQHQMQMIMFMKNLSMLGGALLIASHGAGSISLDAILEK
jgi:putative oxidoreductase